MAIKIGIDAGHGLKTNGKQTPNGVKEWSLNDKIADKVTTILKDYDCEIIRTDKNEGNTDESLASRLSKYLNAKVDAFVSIHHNAFTGKWGNATGVEVYTDRNPTTKDKELAKCIYNRLVKYTGLKGRGIKKENWHVINQNKIPAVLVEGGFMDSRNDYKVITSDAGQTAYAKAVAEGLIEFLGLTKKVAKPATTTTSTTATTTTKTTNTTSSTSTTLNAGAKLTLKKVPLYSSSAAKTKANTKTGTYYVWSAEAVNGKIRITNSAANVGKVKKITGWISVTDAKSSVVTTTKTSTATKSLDAWAKEVIDGKHGNGHTNRENSLKKAGCTYSYAKVKARVNALLK